MKSTYLSAEQMARLPRGGFTPVISPNCDFRLQEGHELIRFVQDGQLEFAIVPASALVKCTGKTQETKCA